MQRNKLNLFVIAVVLVVAITIGAGLFVVGSPQEERARRFDEQRVQDLQSIQSFVIEYWQSKGKLVTNLDYLNDATRGITVPKDPENYSSYTYSVSGSLDFKLCANFSRASFPTDRPALQTEPVKAGFNDNWQHTAGQTCFDRHLDPDFFKTNLVNPPSMAPALAPVK